MKNLRKEWTDAEIPLHILERLNQIVSFEKRIDDLLDQKETSLEEYELKIKCSDKFIDNLKKIPFEYKNYEIEKSYIYDDFEMSLHKVDARLRIRTFQNPENKNSSSLITVKKPKPKDGIGNREFESEILIKDRTSEEVVDLFIAQNFKIVSSYERIRHYISIKNTKVKIDIDLLPDIGRFVEIEGPEKDVLEVARKLEIDINSLIYDPYDTLHADWCLEQNKPEEDFVKFLISEKELILQEEIFKNRLLDKN